ncbi:MAG TPA: hypothetical protein VGP68_03320 [Gemmataceae bacterium]|jgi:hypothetical protein|nr:hypothetical protein [Gemmataceae bacterium]
MDNRNGSGFPLQPVFTLSLRWFAAVEASRMGKVSEVAALLLFDARHKSF